MQDPGQRVSPLVPLLLLVLAAYAYFYQAGGWNQNSRFDLVRSTVEEGSSRIDRFYRNTGDLACRGPEGRCGTPLPELGQHAYSDKAPGLSWLAAPVYALVHRVSGDRRADDRYLDAAAYLSTVGAVGVPSAIAVALLYLMLGALGAAPRGCATISLAYGLATLAFPYATLLYGHQLGAALVLIGFALLVRARRAGGSGPPRAVLLLGVGLLLGYAVVVEYPAALAVAPVCVYAALSVRPWPRLGWLVAGMAVPCMALAAYHWVSFGGPLTLPYEFSTQVHRSQGFFMGLGVPSLEVLWAILGSSYRGLFYSSPWLLLAVPGAVLLARRGFKAEVWVSVAVVLLFLWLNASLVDWQGGWAVGPRYLIPAIPFLAVMAAGTAARPPGSDGGVPVRPWLRVAGRVAALLAIAYSAFMMLVATAVKPEVPMHIPRPFSEFLFERFRAGDLSVNRQSIDAFVPARDGEPAAFNLGQMLGLDGLLSLLPLLLLAAAAGAWLWRAGRGAEPGGGTE